MTTSFTRMDESTEEQWRHIGRAVAKAQPRVVETVLAMLRGLEAITDGFAVNQLVHSLQTATRAERAGADREVVVAALCHDIGKFVSVANHAAIAAELLKPYVRHEVYWVIRVHGDFQGKHFFHYFEQDPNARKKHEGHPAYDLAARFADEWDQTAFDPSYDTLPLAHFEPLVREVFERPALYAGG